MKEEPSPQPPPPRYEDIHRKNSVVEVGEITGVDELYPVPTFFQLIPIKIRTHSRKLLVLVIVLLVFAVAIFCTLFFTLRSSGKSGNNYTTSSTHLYSVTSTSAVQTVATSTKPLHSTGSTRAVQTVGTTPVKTIATTALPITPDADGCIEQAAGTFVFAYSNDLNPELVMSARNSFFFNLPSWSLYGNIRFDTFTPGNIEYFRNYKDYVSVIAKNLPNPKDGFTGSYTGSDILNSFLGDPKSRNCGSAFFILLKRLPNENDAANLISLLPKHHVFIHLIQSIEPSGGINSDLMYQVATQTNGFCSFQDDTDQDKYSLVAYWTTTIIAFPYFAYAASPRVAGTGTIALPPFYASKYTGQSFIEVSVQDHPDDFAFGYLNLTFTNGYNDQYFYIDKSTLVPNRTGTAWFGYGYFFNAHGYNVNLDYWYSSNRQQTLQIRIWNVYNN